MKQHVLLLTALVSVCTATAGPLDWPKQSSVTKPWTYWWVMGSAMDEANVKRELTRYRDAGLGGVHIIPIYGAKGWEDKYIPYLSPRWMEMMGFTVAEASKLGMGVDMTTGTGWCFGGGPNVGESDGNASVVVKTFTVSSGGTVPEKLDASKTQSLMAFAPDGGSVELTGKIKDDGSVDWNAPGDDWSLYAISQKFSGQKVKRAAIGGEGPMLNLIYTEAMENFLSGFTDAFDGYKGPKPRAQYHDSYEYRSDWSPDFFAQFEKRRGYKLQNELPALFGGKESDRAARVKADYRETVSDVMVEETLPMWVKWSHKRGFVTRNEAHGSPGNLLDLYAVADIPETEMFRNDRSVLIGKFASSAAHVAGKNLVSAETGTWLAEHFTETLADVKYLMDDMFLSGINHVFYHGTCYSPDEAAWPGWVFYASTQMNPRNSIWRDARAVNDYISRCQSVLQSGKPDSDVLLYWPIQDYWHKAGGLLPHLKVHGPDWFDSQPIGKTANWLWERGYSFDYVSDRQLASATVKQGRVRMPGGNYQVIVVPRCERMPLETLSKLVALVKAGAEVIFEGDRPADVSGWGALETRRAAFTNLLARIPGVVPNISTPQLHTEPGGKGRFHTGDLGFALNSAGVRSERMTEANGLHFIRRAMEDGSFYFIANTSRTNAVDGWVSVSSNIRSVVLMDALTGRTGVGAVKTAGKTGSHVYLQLPPGASVILRGFDKKKVKGSLWNYNETISLPVALEGRWRVEFLAGGPEVPKAFETEALGSWTEVRDPDVDAFAGTARYSITFDVPDSSAKQFSLDLGDVRQSARVKLNGKDYGTLITPPFSVVVDALKPQGNVLEVEVTSVAANRIRDMDRRAVKWKNFHDINFVNQNYRPFDASEWPLTPCGLLGPVTLTPVTPVGLD